MNCRNCGGAMELFPARGYFFCRYCSSFHFPEATAPDGVRVLAPSADGLSCPACRKTLASALLDEAHTVNYCQNCRGVLLSRGAFADVVRLRRAWATGTPANPIRPEQEELNRRSNCPMCRKHLATHPYYGPGNVVIDTCDTCDVVWLDFGELRQIVDAPGRDRGGRESAAAKDSWMPDATTGRVLMNRGDEDAGDGRSRTGGRSPDLLDLLGELFDR
jgi:Zn-finger nucleic acid-binding protein